jgi:hypothetical protein
LYLAVTLWKALDTGVFFLVLQDVVATIKSREIRIIRKKGLKDFIH